MGTHLSFTNLNGHRHTGGSPFLNNGHHNYSNFSGQSDSAQAYGDNYQHDRSFKINHQTLQLLYKQSIVENNFSYEFDPLFTTFRPQNKSIYGKFHILCSNITNERIQQYQISFRNQEDFRTYVVSYFWRKIQGQAHNWPIVMTSNFVVYEQSKNQLEQGISGFFNRTCSSSTQISCKVFVEDIPMRLCHIKDIPFPENLYVLRQALVGFKIVYNNIGYIKPFEGLICITRKGVVKVWINSDLGKNYPNIENIEQNKTCSKSQSKLINQILQIVGSNTDSQGQPMSFQVYLKQKHVNLQFISFQKVLEMIERYSADFMVQIPDTFGSVLQVLNQQQQQYDTYRTDIEPQNSQNNQSNQVRSSSGSGLFLNVPNQASRNMNKKKKSKRRKTDYSNIQSSNSRNINKKQSSSKRKNKTRSLKVENEEINSMGSSMAGFRSNFMLSESLPISRNLKIPSSSYQAGGNSITASNKDISRSRQQSSRINKMSAYEMMQISIKSSLNSITNYQQQQLKGKIVNHGHINRNRLNGNEIFQQNQKLNGNNKRRSDQSLRHKVQFERYENRVFQDGNQPHTNLINQQNLLKVAVKHAFKNQTKKPNDQTQQELQIAVTEQELAHMKQIDRYLQEQIIEEEYEKQKQEQIQLSQLNIQSDHQNELVYDGMSMNNDESHFFQGNDQIPILEDQIVQYNTINLQYPSADILPSNSQQIYDYSDSTNNLKHNPHPQLFQQKNSNHKNQNSARPQNSKNQPRHFPTVRPKLYPITKVQSNIMPNEDKSLSLQNLPQISKINILVPNSSDQSKSQISARGNNVFEMNKNQIYSPNHLYPQSQINRQPVGSNSSIKNMNSMNSHQSNIQRPSLPITSATSIGYNVNINSTPVHFPIYQPPQVRFLIKTPQQMSSVQILQSSNTSLNDHGVRMSFPYSHENTSGLRQHQNNHIYSNNVGNQNGFPIQRLANKTKTIVSHYMKGSSSLCHGLTSRRYFENESFSSKPSIVQYSLMNNHQFMANKMQNFNNGCINSPLYIANQLQQGDFKRPLIMNNNPQVFFNNAPQNISNFVAINNQPSLISNPLTGILSIPEQAHVQILSNEREFLNQKSINQQRWNVQKLQKDQIDKFTPIHHRRQSSGVKVLSSAIQERSFEQNSLNLSLQKDQLKSDVKQKDSIEKSQSKLKINIRPTFYSKDSSDKLYECHIHSYHESSKGREYQKSFKKSNQDRQSSQPYKKKSYRFVQSIQQNRPNSTYQEDIENYNTSFNDFIIHQEESRTRGNKHINNGHPLADVSLKPELYAKSGIFQQPFGRSNIPSNQVNPSSSLSPTGSQNISSHAKQFPINPIAGRTMFLNHQNQLNSEFVDQQSQMQSQVDYTYNSYDKWKDTSKVVHGGDQKRFHNFYQRNEEEMNFGQPNVNRYNIVFNSHQRHANHRQLVKSSIQGLNNQFINNLVNNRFKTDKKLEEDKANKWPNDKNAHEIEMVHQMKGKFGIQSFYHGQIDDEIDEQILKDLQQL